MAYITSLLTETTPKRAIKLLSENVSRFGDFGGMLPLPLAGNDGLCRVIINETYPNKQPPPLQQPSDVTYPQFVGLAIRRICGHDGRCWCVGEISEDRGKLIEASFGSEVSLIAAPRNCVLVAYCLHCEQIKKTTQWPMYDGEDGFRVFAFEGSATKLEGTLLHLRHSIREQQSDALPVWRDLCNRCLKRSELAALCNQASFIVSPDGPHFTEAAFHSVRLSAQEISAIICALAQDCDFECSILDNLEEEYKLL